jgi:hypothetical protein
MQFNCSAKAGFFLVAVLATGLFVACGTASAAETESPEQKLSEIDKALFNDMVKLAKFNVHFHLEANRHQKWRNLTYPLARESGTALSFAATLIDLRQQAKGLDSPRRISRGKLKDAVACGITGSAISGSASALELAQNTWVMLSARKKGYSPRASLDFVKGIAANTDRLLVERDQIAAALPAERREVTAVETKLARRIRQQLLFEFANWSAHSRDQAWRENTFYLLDSASNFTRLSGGILARKAFDEPRLARNSVVCALVASSIATVAPIAQNVVGYAVRKHQERKLAREIPHERPPLRSAELDRLQEQLAQRTDETWMRRVAALTHRTEMIDEGLDRETSEIERYRQIAQQQSISGPLIGLTGVASATLATIAVYGYATDPHTAIRLGFAGRITQGTGQAYALINTPYTIISGMVRNHRLRQRGELPSQILEQRLRRLESY